VTIKNTDREIVLDARRRTSLAKIGRKEDSRYLVQEYADGTLVWIPAVTISAVELAALKNPELRDSFDRTRTLDPATLRRRGSFRQYAD
jgi:hypothetical protein